MNNADQVRARALDKEIERMDTASKNLSRELEHIADYFAPIANKLKGDAVDQAWGAISKARAAAREASE